MINKRWALTTAAGRALLVGVRFWQTAREGLPRGWPYLRWLLAERELTNYSYRLTDDSKHAMAQIVDMVAGQPAGTAWQKLQMFETSGRKAQMQVEIDRATAQSSYRWSQNPRSLVDQRMIYYVLTRALKPRLVFQSGTARGVGACLIAAALQENAAEGTPGRLFTSDIDPSQGYGISETARAVSTFISGDSAERVQCLGEPIDLYIHDTAPGALARREFAAVESFLLPSSCLLSTWHTPDTEGFARKLGRPYFTWKDEPTDHWYGGVRIAIIGGLTPAA